LSPIRIFAPMYATRRRVKTDRRDARTLAEALRVGAFRPAHRLSEGQRQVRGELAVRDALVHTRVRFIGVVKALVRREGLRIAGGAAEHLGRKLAALPLSPSLQAELAPLLALLEPLNAQIAAADARLATRTAADPVVARLTTAPTIGPVTAVAFVATLDDVGRFGSAHRVAAYLGLTPSERSSGEQQRRGRISKTGNRGCAACWWRPRGGSCAPSSPPRQGSGPGRSKSPRGAGVAWRRWPSPGGSRGFSMRCGATAGTTAACASPTWRSGRGDAFARVTELGGEHDTDYDRR
jgi:transposase